MKLINGLLYFFKIMKIKNYEGKYINFGISSSTKIVSFGGKLKIGDKVSIRENSYISSSTGELTINDNVFINQNCYICAKEKIIIGENTIIGPNVVIVDHDHDYKNSDITENEFKTKKIFIGKNVWIGANVVILKGTIIGDNCVIAAGTVLNGSYDNNKLIYQKRENLLKDI